MTVQLTCFVFKMCVLLEYLNEVLCVNAWHQLSKHFNDLRTFRVQ